MTIFAKCPVCGRRGVEVQHNVYLCTFESIGANGWCCYCCSEMYCRGYDYDYMEVVICGNLEEIERIVIPGGRGALR
jgi:hypothetical protein